MGMASAFTDAELEIEFISRQRTTGHGPGARSNARLPPGELGNCST